MPSKKKNRSHVYVSIPVGQLMDVAWVLSTLHSHQPAAVADINRDAKLAGFDTDMVTNAFNTIYFATNPGQDEPEVRAQLVEEYERVRTEDVMRDIYTAGTPFNEVLLAEVRGLVKEVAARLSNQELRDETADILASTPD